MLADIHNHFKNMKFDVISSAANDDYVFTLVHMTGTTADSSMGMPGQNIDETEVDVVKFNKDNKAVEHWGFMEIGQVEKERMQMQGNMGSQGQSKMKK